VNELHSLFDRQVEYLRRQQGERLLLLVPRFVRTVTEEPRFTAIADDIVADYVRALTAFADADRSLAQELLSLWRTHGEWFTKAWVQEVAKERTKPEWAAVYGGPPETLPQRLARAGQHELPKFEQSGDPSAIGEVLPAIGHWMACLKDNQSWTGDEAMANQFMATVRQAEADHERALRAFLVVTRTHPGAAWNRLVAFAASLVPPREVHAPDDDGWAILEKYTRTLDQLRVSNAALKLGQYDHAIGDAEKYRERIIEDLDLFSEEVRHRIGLRLSRRALVRRFKTRCERFDAAVLRAAIANEPKRKPEDILTIALAKYLFDQGLNPLFNAEIVKLRPDLFDSTGPFAFYVEAKQYADKPQKLITKAAWQVWDTWNELDGQYEVPEAFLLVFRRGGPLVVFDSEFVRAGSRTLYPLLVDIAEPASKGSRAKQGPVHITAADLSPKDDAK